MSRIQLMRSLTLLKLKKENNRNIETTETYRNNGGYNEEEVLIDMEYHVLSNSDIISILRNVAIAALFMWPMFSYFAGRNASKKHLTKGVFRKITPWVLLSIFLSEFALLISRLYNYPWDIEAVPSQASAYREMQYLSTGFILYGWANDYQLPLLSSLSGAVLWFCWTVYAYNFKPSDTSWWKKACKVIAYIIISIIIFGFQLHQFGDLWGYAMLLVIIVALLWIAHVKPEKKEESKYNDALIGSRNIVEECSPTSNEDPSRFIPTASFVKNVTESIPVEKSKPIEQVEEIHEVVSTCPEFITGEVVLPETTPVNDNPLQNEIAQNKEPDMMYCKHCGKRIESDSTFCKYCGKRL